MRVYGAKKNLGYGVKLVYSWSTPKTLTLSLLWPLWPIVTNFGISIAWVIFKIATKFGRGRITPRGVKPPPPKFFLWRDLELERWPWPRRSRCHSIELVDFHRGEDRSIAVPRVLRVFCIHVTVAIFPHGGCEKLERSRTTKLLHILCSESPRWLIMFRARFYRSYARK